MNKKILSLGMAAVSAVSAITPALATPQVSGDGQSVPVELTVEKPTFSVTVPTGLPIAVDADGKVYYSTNATIKNNTFGQVKVFGVTIDGNAPWTVASWDLDMQKEKVNTTKIAMQLNNGVTAADGYQFDPANFPVMDGHSSLPLTYDAKLPAQTKVISGDTVANVVFTVGWNTDGADTTDPTAKPHAMGTPFSKSKLDTIAKEKTGTLTFSRKKYNSFRRSAGVDISEAQDGSVICVTSGNDVTVYGDGGVKAPADCTSLFQDYQAKTMDLSGLDTQNVTNMDSMFAGIKTAKLNTCILDTSSATSMKNLFDGASTTNIVVTDPTYTKMIADNADIEKAIVVQVIGAPPQEVVRDYPHATGSPIDQATFEREIGYLTGSVKFSREAAPEAAVTPLNSDSTVMAHIDGQNATIYSKDGGGVFAPANSYGFFAKKHEEIGSWPWAKPIDATNIDLYGLDTSKVTSMDYMFVQSKASYLDLSTFDLSNVTSMNSMLIHGHSTVNLSKFSPEDIKNHNNYGDLVDQNDSDMTVLCDTEDVKQALGGYSFIYTKYIQNLNTSNVLDQNAMMLSLKDLTGTITFANEAPHGIKSDAIPLNGHGPVYPDATVFADIDGENATVYATTGKVVAPEDSYRLVQSYRANILDFENLDMSKIKGNISFFVIDASIIYVPNVAIRDKLIAGNNDAKDKIVVRPKSSNSPVDPELMKAALGSLTGNITFSSNPAIPEAVTPLNGDGTVLAHINGQNATVYSKNGGVAAPINSSNLFKDYQAQTIDLTGLDTGSVTNMSGMFQNTAATDIRRFFLMDTENVTDMSNMFNNSNVEDLMLGNIKTSNVDTVAGMFQGSKAILVDLSSFDFSKSIDITNMFQNSSVTKVYASNSSNVTKLKNGAGASNSNIFRVKPATLDPKMFYTPFHNVTGTITFSMEPAPSLATIPLNSNGTVLVQVSGNDATVYSKNGGGVALPPVTDNAFPDFRVKAKTIDFSGLDTSFTVDMSDMFMYNSTVTSMIGLTGFDTRHVVDMYGMFEGCKVPTLDLSGFDIKSTTNVSYMFESSTTTTVYVKDEATRAKLAAETYARNPSIFKVKQFA